MSDSALPAKTPPGRPLGRPADGLASLLAAFGTILSVLTAIWFFAGFAENDTRPEHLASAFILTLGLFSLAIIPFAITAGLARRAYRKGGRIRDYLWSLFLMLPWIGIGGLSLSHTPLPIWAGLITLLLASLLGLWALISCLLEMRSRNPSSPQAFEKSDTTHD